ncbi:MAG TPA: NifB/NifX family molybdenum-iron cluster-binding protein [Fervidobacterium sp.]|nr:NifB/NifX family molybdenum-iron cluster-binding protein [Fervidobacterium sp.]
MKVRIVIPTIDDSGLSSRIPEHFGRALCFTVIELEEDGSSADIKSKVNRGGHFGGRGKPKDMMIELNPTVVIVAVR